MQSKGFPIGVRRYYKKCLKARLGASFLTCTVEGPQCVIREAKEAIPKEKRPHDPMCLITSTGGELPVDFSLLNYCLGLRLTQPSRIKYEYKLFLINNDELKGKPS